MLIYAMSSGSFDKWKDLWAKVIDASHPSISIWNFNKHKEEFRQSLQKDNETLKEKISNFIKSDSKTPSATKDEVMSDAST
jgi:hypothetical protein